MSEFDQMNGILVLPRLRVQNVNTISSPMTWGFPSMTAFTGLMWALERRFPISIAEKMILMGVGVICHSFEPQASKPGDYQFSFHLTRNPLDEKGETKSIAEEGRAHIEVTLVFGVCGNALIEGKEQRQEIADQVAAIVNKMRIAGGSVIPSPKDNHSRWQPALIPLESTSEEREEQFRKLRYQWLPGSALVLREDLLQSNYESMKSQDDSTTLVDAWLDFSRLSYSAVESESAIGSPEASVEAEWHPRQRSGWLVPIPVGYAALSDLHTPGAVEASRDSSTGFRFVESIYSVGQWISPHRLNNFGQMLWYSETDAELGIYKCTNEYVAL